ncbi:MAG: bifunctional DNA-formamidopyrimidine glycosylase/DNA-(apurinic or apyrimidinic site) lyase [Rhizobiaceae bacterium]
MPELPEVETVRRGLAPVMEGATVTKLELRRPNLRFPFPEKFEKRVTGQRIISLGRRAKYLLVDLEDGHVIIMHLGMSGSFRTEEEPGITDTHHKRERNEKHDHVVLHLKTESGGTARVIYNDPRRFGFMLMERRADLADHKMFKDLGVEPVGNALDGAELARKVIGKKAPLKAALLDQKVVAGLGNIYVCEALWRCGLSPTKPSGILALKNGKPTAKANQLAQIIAEVIAEAIEAGGSSLQDHAQTDGTLGYFQHRFAVYDQEDEPCRKDKCKGKIKRIVQSGRSTFYCPQCQR